MARVLQVKLFLPNEFAKVRDWLFELDGEVWDRKLQADSQSDKLDELLGEARAVFRSGLARAI